MPYLKALWDDAKQNETWPLVVQHPVLGMAVFYHSESALRHLPALHDMRFPIFGMTLDEEWSVVPEKQGKRLLAKEWAKRWGLKYEGN